MAAKRKSGGRRTSSRVLGVLNTDTIKNGALTYGGMLGTNYVVDRIPWAPLQTPVGSALGKFGVAIVGGMALRKFAGVKVSNAFVLGGVMAAMDDVYTTAMGQRGQARLAGVPFGYEPRLSGGGVGNIGYFPNTTEEELEEIVNDDTLAA